MKAINQLKQQNQDIGRGGVAGEVFIFTRNIVGDGKIDANGGDGFEGGKGGKVTIVSDNNQFSGNISTQGGQSWQKIRWWENSWVQAVALLSAILGIIGFIIFAL